MTRSDEVMIPTPEGTVSDIKVLSSVMAQRYRESQPAINRPSQDTLPNRE